MTSPRRRCPGFTLIELLIAVVLTLIVAGTATLAIGQMLQTTRRLQALQTMDGDAQTVHGKLAAEFATLHPCAGVFLNSSATDRSVELVFMFARRTPIDHLYETRMETQRSNGAFPGFTDIVWTRWHWSWYTRTLTAASSNTARWTRVFADQARDYWKISGGSKMNHTVPSGYKDAGWPYFNGFLSVPRLVRETGTGNPQPLLDANSWGTGEDSDIGDYAELLCKARPILADCTDLRIELVDRLGRVTAVDGSTNTAWAAPGTFVDGRGRGSLDDRPSQVRIMFTLTSPTVAGVNRTYSFSCAGPGIPTY